MELLTIGPVHSLVQNTIYALPARAVKVLAGAAVEVNTESGTTGWAALASSTTGVETSATFIRCTTGNTTISLKV